MCGFAFWTSFYRTLFATWLCEQCVTHNDNEEERRSFIVTEEMKSSSRRVVLHRVAPLLQQCRAYQAGLVHDRLTASPLPQAHTGASQLACTTASQALHFHRVSPGLARV